MSPVAYTWSPFSAKIFLKIWFCKIDPLLPPHIDFNTIPYFTYGCPYRGVKEGKLKTIELMNLSPQKRTNKETLDRTKSDKLFNNKKKKKKYSTVVFLTTPLFRNTFGVILGFVSLFPFKKEHPATSSLLGKMTNTITLGVVSGPRETRVGEPRENPGELGDRTNTNLSTAQSLQGPTSHGTCNSPTKELSMPCIKVHYENIGRE